MYGQKYLVTEIRDKSVLEVGNMAVCDTLEPIRQAINSFPWIECYGMVGYLSFTPIPSCMLAKLSWNKILVHELFWVERAYSRKVFFSKHSAWSRLYKRYLFKNVLLSLIERLVFFC